MGAVLAGLFSVEAAPVAGGLAGFTVLAAEPFTAGLSAGFATAPGAAGRCIPALEPAVFAVPVFEAPILELAVLEPPVLKPPALELAVLEPPALKPADAFTAGATGLSTGTGTARKRT